MTEAGEGNFEIGAHEEFKIKNSYMVILKRPFTSLSKNKGFPQISRMKAQIVQRKTEDDIYARRTLVQHQL